ncbi:MAG: flagellar filament capping protein FliD [Phycisphaerales bacterium]|nr:flagellar filament capping protein FliD [Phycisphaerales bacterium]
MSGISSNTGLISGLDTQSIINQLLAVESRPKAILQTRVVDLKAQQAAYLDLNSKLSALRTASQKLRLDRLFSSVRVNSSNADALTGTATPGAPAGNYSFIVDRLVSTQQVLSRGIADRNTSALGLTSVSIEPPAARLDSDTELSQFNNGSGVSRGKVLVTNRAGVTATIDLSRVSKTSEVLAAFNSNSDLKVTASVSGGRLVLTDTSGGSGSLQVRSSSGYTTAASLGIEQTVAGTTLNGSVVYGLNDNTLIRSLNDGNGIRIRTGTGSGDYDFRVLAKDGTSYNIDIGDVYDTQAVKTASAVTTVGQLRSRIEQQTGNRVTLQINPQGTGFSLVDQTGGVDRFEIQDTFGAAADLGLTTGTGATNTTTGATLSSKTLLAGLNGTLATALSGGSGIADGAISITARSGTVYSFNLNTTGSITDLLESFNTGTSGAVKARLDARGTSIILSDTTGGSQNLGITGAAATALGIATGPTGVASSSISGRRLERGYVSLSTQLNTLNAGRGVGTGSFVIRGANGNSKTVNISADLTTVEDVLRQINGGTNVGVRARVNDSGSGILLERDPAFTDPDVKISVTDSGGSVARNLNILGEAAGTGASNTIDGSFRRTIALSATDTLDGVITKLNTARAGVNAALVTDGGSATPFRLRITSSNAGETGRFLLDTTGSDLAFSTLSEGLNTRAFYGSDDPANAILISRASLTIDGVVDNLRVDVKTTSATPVSLTVSSDNDATVKGIQDFVTAFNTLASKLGEVTTYDADTERRGTLLGDSAALALRTELFSVIQGPGQGVSGRYRVLGQVGLKINRDNTISIDESKLRTALQNDPQGVADLFSGFSQQQAEEFTTLSSGIRVRNTDTRPRFTQLGVLERIGQLADRYVNSVDGVLTTRNRGLDTQINTFNRRLTDFDTRIADKRSRLERQFANLETSLAKLQRQSSALSGLGSGGSASG